MGRIIGGFEVKLPVWHVCAMKLQKTGGLPLPY